MQWHGLILYFEIFAALMINAMVYSRLFLYFSRFCVIIGIDAFSETLCIYVPKSFLVFLNCHPYPLFFFMRMFADHLGDFKSCILSETTYTTFHYIYGNNTNTFLLLLSVHSKTFFVILAILLSWCLKLVVG